MKTSKFEIGTRVNGSKGMGTISDIITKSTGYVEVRYDNGILKKEMAFNLKSENGEALKSAPKKSEPKQISLLDQNKMAVSRVNGIVKGDRNSMSFQLFEQAICKVQMAAKQADNNFIYDVCESILKYMSASEKQSFVVARFATENSIAI